MKNNKKGGLKNGTILLVILILALCLVGGQVTIIKPNLTLKTDGVYKFYEEYNREKGREFERDVKWAEMQRKY